MDRRKFTSRGRKGRVMSQSYFRIQEINQPTLEYDHHVEPIPIRGRSARKLLENRA